MTIRKIRFGSLNDLIGELNELSRGLANGYVTPGAVSTVLQARDALSAMTTEAAEYEAMLRSTIGALSGGTQGCAAVGNESRSDGDQAWLPRSNTPPDHAHGGLKALVSN